MTKDQIIKCQDGQALADAVAVEVMGWTWEPIGADDFVAYCWIGLDDKVVMNMKAWQPHKPTEKGKAQAIDLAENFGMEIIMPYDGLMVAEVAAPNHDTSDKSWQIAVLKAALLTVKE